MYTGIFHRAVLWGSFDRLHTYQKTKSPAFWKKCDVTQVKGFLTGLFGFTIRLFYRALWIDYTHTKRPSPQHFEKGVRSHIYRAFWQGSFDLLYGCFIGLFWSTTHIPNDQVPSISKKVWWYVSLPTSSKSLCFPPFLSHERNHGKRKKKERIDISDCTNHVTQINMSCHRCEGVMTRINTSTHALVDVDIWTSHVTHMNESCHTYEWVMSHIWMSHVTSVKESCHTYEWAMSHV